MASGKSIFEMILLTILAKKTVGKSNYILLAKQCHLLVLISVNATNIP